MSEPETLASRNDVCAACWHPVTAHRGWLTHPDTVGECDQSLSFTERCECPRFVSAQGCVADLLAALEEVVEGEWYTKKDAPPEYWDNFVLAPDELARRKQVSTAIAKAKNTHVTGGE